LDVGTTGGDVHVGTPTFKSVYEQEYGVRVDCIVIVLLYSRGMRLLKMMVV